MNLYDSARLEEALSAHGMRKSPEGRVDVIILNTCHIREKATEKLFSELGRLRRAHEEASFAIIGCVAQAEAGLIRRRAPYVQFIAGPQEIHRLAESIVRWARQDNPRATREAIEPFTALEARDKFDMLPEERQDSGASAFLTIQEGCDKFCSFCVVPFTRGPEFSRSADDIVSEAKILAAQGAKEIVLLGQNVNAWSQEEEKGTPRKARLDFAGLLEVLVDSVPKIKRWRYTTSHPNEVTARLIEAHASLPSLAPALHLPVQSGSDRILHRMNRKHSARDYLEIVAKLRKARPDIALSSDFIVAYPGETREDFQQTLRLVHEVRFDAAYSFIFSPRPGTPAARQTTIDQEEAKDRLQALQQLLDAQQQAANHRLVGETLPTLITHHGKKPKQRIGKSPYFQNIHIDAEHTKANDSNSNDPKANNNGQVKNPVKIGEFLPVTIIGTTTHGLVGYPRRLQSQLHSQRPWRSQHPRRSQHLQSLLPSNPLPPSRSPSRSTPTP